MLKTFSQESLNTQFLRNKENLEKETHLENVEKEKEKENALKKIVEK